jgi:hypothetical protein
MRGSDTSTNDIGSPSVLEKHGPTELKEKHGSNVRFLLTTLTLAVLGFLAIYLQYVVYPSIMSNVYGETQIQLHLSFLTYWYSAKNCVVSSSCLSIAGVPAFDFAQLFFIILAVTTIFHLAKTWRTA